MTGQGTIRRSAARGFTLVELVVVIAIVVILIGLALPVLVRAVRQTRQTTCLSNQRQIALNLIMLVQDNDGHFPPAHTVWDNLELAPKFLRCPAAGRRVANAYVYNAYLANVQQNQVQMPEETFLVTDGRHLLDASSGAWEVENVAYTPADFAYRHGHKLTASFADGRADVRSHLVFRHRINPKDGAVMVYVPPGRFLMGGGDGEEPREVHLDGYWIYKYEVTVTRFRRFCEATGHPFPATAPVWGWQTLHPMVNLTWEDARAYAQWAGAALPSEAQWEKATRAVEGADYPWPDQLRDPNRANCLEDRGPEDGEAPIIGTTPVGSYPLGASHYGAMDLAGNAWEFCADVIVDTPPPGTPPDAAPPEPRYIIRGGSFSSPFNTLRASARRVIDGSPRDDCGFRCIVPE